MDVDNRIAHPTTTHVRLHIKIAYARLTRWRPWRRSRHSHSDGGPLHHPSNGSRDAHSAEDSDSGGAQVTLSADISAVASPSPAAPTAAAPTSPSVDVTIAGTATLAPPSDAAGVDASSVSADISLVIPIPAAQPTTETTSLPGVASAPTPSAPTPGQAITSPTEATTTTFPPPTPIQLTSRQDLAANAQSVLASIKPHLEQLFGSDIDTAENVVRVEAFNFCNAYIDQSQNILISVLEGIQGIHPAVHVVVSVFKVAIKWECERRDNDRKVRAVYVAMMYMMTVFLEFAGDTMPAYNEPVMAGTLDGIADIIRESVVICQAYRADSLVMQVVRANKWARKLNSRLASFKECRKRLHLALALEARRDAQRSAAETSSALKHIAEQMENLSSKVDPLFHLVEAPKTQKLILIVTDPANPDADPSDKALDDLHKRLKDEKMISDKWEFTTDDQFRKAVKTELKVTMEAILAKDRETVLRTLEDLSDKLDQLKQDVIRAITSGEHMHLEDNEMRTVWERMHWTADSVQAAHFVVAVRDYFVQNYTPTLSEPATGGEGSIVLLPSPEEWAVKQITIDRVRPIMDAIDEDSSAWISVREVNVFTASGTRGRPKNWELVKWFAYWATGFPSVCEHYAYTIARIRASMIKTASKALPCNRYSVNRYLDWPTLRTVDYLVRGTTDSFDPWDSQSSLPEAFQSYVDSEERRLEVGLARYKWNIPDSSVLFLITGGGRLERHIMPLLFLLLRRHLHIIRYACDHPISPVELWDAIDPIIFLVGEAWARFGSLGASFRTQNRDPKIEFSLSSHGMFSVLYEEDAKRDTFQYDVLPDYDDEIHEQQTDSLSPVPYKTTSRTEMLGFLDHVGYLCDYCKLHVEGPRLRCLECQGAKGLRYSIDLCAEKTECAGASFIRDSDGTSHSANHPVLKTMRALHFREITRITNLARMRYEEGAKLFSQTPSVSSAGDPVPPYICMRCAESLSAPPFWLCVECTDIAVLCNNCDLQQVRLLYDIDTFRMDCVKNPFTAEASFGLDVLFDMEPSGEYQISEPVPDVEGEGSTTLAGVERTDEGGLLAPNQEGMLPQMEDNSGVTVLEPELGSLGDVPVHEAAEEIDPAAPDAADVLSTTSGDDTSRDPIQNEFYRHHPTHEWWHVLVPIRTPQPAAATGEAVETRLQRLEVMLEEIKELLRERGVQLQSTNV